MSPSTTRDTAVKWTAYALACLLLLFGHELTLAHLRVWGIAPFLPPLLPAVLASMEDRLEGFVFALAFGVLCDLALTAPLPCLYTIAFPLTALLAALIARSVLQPGILCSLAVSTAAFVLVDLITAVTLLAGGRSELSAIALRAVQELALSAAADRVPPGAGVPASEIYPVTTAKNREGRGLPWTTKSNSADACSRSARSSRWCWRRIS